MTNWQECFIYTTFTFCTIFWAGGFIVGGIVAIVFGSSCLRTDTYGQCGSENGALLFIIFGALAIVAAIAYVIFLIIKREKVDNVLNDIDTSLGCC